jgi:hypothetical protein
MRVFRRKKKWQDVIAKLAADAGRSPAVKSGAGALAGLMTLTAASAAVSSARRKSQS